MISSFQACNLFAAISFFGFGTTCLVTDAMRKEFQRYGLCRYRALTGWLQLAGATGLITGFFLPLVGLAAATGLSLQMLAGLVARIRIGDTWYQCLPAGFYFILNAILVWMYQAEF